ncbi:MAG: hypothetical protein QM703_13860 [Gemmatales bacterium]
MANKKLKVGGGELKLPAKKDKSEKKPKWQAKTGKKANASRWPRGRKLSSLP